jgi:oligopeptide/dipeptide ABC transporter ATP-binding protein
MDRPSSSADGALRRRPGVRRGGEDRLLVLDNVSVEFKSPHGTVHAVDRVSLSIGKGETVAVVGESGSGKSVTSLAILRLLDESIARTTASRLAFRRRDGRFVDLLQLARHQMRDIRGDEIGMIFQEPMTSLNPMHTVGDQITEVLRIHRRADRRGATERAIEVLAQVGMPEPQRHLSSYPHQLSGGMRQRVMIAMALACKPSLLIADEPTTALDVTIQAQILDLFRSLRDDGDQSMLFITHDLGVVAEVADFVYVMYAGQVVESGDVTSILCDPRHPYTKGLVASVLRVDRPRAHGSRFYAIPGRVPEPGRMPQGCRFQTRCGAFLPGVCDAAIPPLEAFETGRDARCFRQKELAHVDAA